jgi:ribosomal protein S18 acetylase RimI-like enzyme
MTNSIHLEIVTLEGKDSLELIPCNKDAHGGFIRKLTRGNFYSMMNRSFGWDENRHQQEPRFPERYSMIQRDLEMIGFFSIRLETSFLYLETIQLLPSYRNKGYGAALLEHIENLAKSKNLFTIRLRVFKENPAHGLYQRLGYKIIETDEYSYIMERALIK